MKLERKVLTTGEVAEYCDVNFRTVIRWIERGLLDAYKLPGRGDNRVPVKSLIKFLEENNMPIPDTFQESNLRVLIVEDQPEMAKAIERVLRRAGYETRTAGNGFVAGAMLHSFKPALMTLDLSMPGLNGFDVLRFTRSEDELKDIKILVISGRPQEDLQKAVEQGVDDAIAKPFANTELLARVKALTGSSS